MNEVLWSWARAFLFTQIVEVPVYRKLLGLGWARAFVPSALTHPIVWFVFPAMAAAAGVGYVTMVVAAEAFAWLAEAAFLSKTSPTVAWSRALGASLTANAASVALGLATRWLLGVP